MHIRVAASQDVDGVREVHQSAFDKAERGPVSELAVRLLAEVTSPPTLSLVAECDAGTVVGHIAFSPVTIANREATKAYILAPLAVRPDQQGRGVGSQLVEAGKQELARQGVQLLLVYGDPKFYGRFGFRAEVAAGLAPPYPLHYPHGWQGCVLAESALERASGAISCVEALCAPSLW
jgi:putative acetyltransferase